MKLTADRIYEITHDCLYNDDEVVGVKEGEPPDGAIVVEGLVHTFAFHPVRLQSHKEEIRHFIRELPTAFYEGGHTFLLLPTLQDGTLWGQQSDAERLFCLAAGLGMAEFQLPRGMWSALPGGVPYVSFDPYA